jgi:hypothetical protein
MTKPQRFERFYFLMAVFLAVNIGYASENAGRSMVLFLWKYLATNTITENPTPAITIHNLSR